MVGLGRDARTPGVAVEAVVQPAPLLTLAAEAENQVRFPLPPATPCRIPPPDVVARLDDRLREGRVAERGVVAGAVEKGLDDVGDEPEQEQENLHANHLTIKEIIAETRTKVKYYRSRIS